MEHTKGEWRLTERINTINIDNGHYCVADISKEYNDAKANAQLIATAPELLKCCEEMAIILSDTKLVGRYGNYHAKGVVKSLKETINKAKGE